MRSKFPAIVALVLMGTSGTAMSATLLSENFDELTANLDVAAVGAFSTVGGTNVDIVGSADGFAALCAAPESGNCVDLNGTGGNPQGELQSSMLFGAGSYLLSYDLIGSRRGQTDSATVTFGSYTQEVTLTSSDVSSGIVVDVPVTVTTPGYLTFASDTTGNVGLVLDNVSVSTAVPEPAAFSLLGFGLAGVGFMRRRKAT
jgi:hypothetical protein